MPIRAGLLFCLCLLGFKAAAFSYVMPSDEHLLEQSEGVLLLRIESRQPATDGALETRYQARVLERLAGPPAKALEALALPGSFDAPNSNFRVPGVPLLHDSSQILLFYSRRSDGLLQPQQLSLGLFGRVEDAAGEAYFVRYLEGSTEYEAQSATRRYHAPRAARAFLDWLRAGAHATGTKSDYLRPEIALPSLAKYTFSVFGFPQPGPGRWFQFDSGQTLLWTDRPGGQAGTTTSVTSLQQALAAWVNDSGSRIQLGYNGTQASSPVCNSSSDPGCFTGHVLWNDPNSEIAGSYNCSTGGVLGIGGSSAFSNGQSFNGQTWYPRARARVVIQDGAGCFMASAGGANGAELLTHEVGHTLAFGHSCGDSESPACGSSAVLNQATMRASAHGDGRGAVLGTDDSAGAAVAYPMPPDTTAPTAPGNLNASAAGATSANLSWTASTDSGGSGLAGYRIERCQGAACSGFAQIGTSMGASYSDAGLSAGNTYRYRVRAVDGAGNLSGYSGTAQVSLAPAPCTGDCVFLDGFE